MKKLRNLLIVAIAIASYSTVSFAGSFGIGATFSQSEISASGTENRENLGTDLNTSSVSNDVLIGSLYAEYSTDSFSFTSDGNGLVIGFEMTPGSADVSDKLKTRTDTSTAAAKVEAAGGNLNLGGTYSANAAVDGYVNTYVEIPVYGMLYVKAGLSSLDVTTNETTANSTSYGNTSLDGDNYGVGLKGKFGGNLIWKAFYEETDFDQLKLTSSGNSTTGISAANVITADLDVKEYGLSIGYQF